ncbi:hypothetical protein niasHT_033597 [Heterodera trifolii]|uniref:ATP-dependent DNA helicase n=1 Tax=Heterodera trifolii TaxID=157864 RepID=A0ABD2I583_9BILA
MFFLIIVFFLLSAPRVISIDPAGVPLPSTSAEVTADVVDALVGELVEAVAAENAEPSQSETLNADDEVISGLRVSQAPGGPCSTPARDDGTIWPPLDSAVLLSPVAASPSQQVASDSGSSSASVVFVAEAPPRHRASVGGRRVEFDVEAGFARFLDDSFNRDPFELPSTSAPGRRVEFDVEAGFARFLDDSFNCDPFEPAEAQDRPAVAAADAEADAVADAEADAVVVDTADPAHDAATPAPYPDFRHDPSPPYPKQLSLELIPPPSLSLSPSSSCRLTVGKQSKKAKFVPAPVSATGFIGPARRLARPRSPTPTGVRVAASPVRKYRPHDIVAPPNLPKDINLGIFKKPISGRDWSDDCATCAAYLSALSTHNDTCVLARLRQLIALMKKCAVGAKENLAHSRGVGIAVQVPKPWPVAEEDGWTGVSIPGCDEKSPIVKPAVAEPRKPKKQTLPKVVPDKRQPWLCNQDGRPIPGLAPVEKASLPVAPLRHVPTDMPRPKNVYHTIVKGKAVTASKLLELSKTDKPRVPIGYAPIAGAGKPALQNRPVLNAVPKPVLRELSEEMFVVGRKAIPKSAMEKAKKKPDVVKKVPTVRRRRTVWNSSSVSFVVPCFYVLQQYIKATTPAVATSAPATKSSSSLSYAQALKKPLPSKPRAVVASAPAIANKPRLEAPRISEEPNWHLFVATGARRKNITTTPNAPMLPLLQKTYAEAARTLKEATKKPLSATARKPRQFFLGDFIIRKGVTGTMKADRSALTTAEAAPKRQRGGGRDSSRSATPTKNEEQHAFLLDCFQRSPEQKQEAFKALKCKFGKNTVPPQAYGRWWQNFRDGKLTLGQRGRPSERSQSERESVSPAQATQLEQQAPQESEAAGDPSGDSELRSTPRSSATNEEQHAFLLDCFQRSPEQKQDAFKALKQQFKNVVSPQTYGRWWNSFLKGEYTLRQRGRPSERSSSARESASPALAVQLEEQHQAPQELEAVGDPTGDNELISAAVRLKELDEGIDITQSSKQTRSSQGQFGKSKKCVFCTIPLHSSDGYVILNCGHSCHFDKPFSDWYAQVPLKKCKFGKCKKIKYLHCKECRQHIGMGIYETGCYCSDASGPVYHADELESRLKESGGKCPDCGTQHPGFCILCQRLFKLQANGLRQSKVFLPCCDSYTHFECWYSPAPKQSCPAKCTKPWEGVQDMHYHQICDVKNSAPLRAVQKPRGIIGGRPLKNAKAASPTESIPSTVDTTTAAASDVSANESQALTDSHLMPPPSLAPRRSTRLSSRQPSIANIQPIPVATKPIAPVTHCCGTIHSAHFGYGCGSKKANHLPSYYNSLRDQAQHNCPHCNALLLASEAVGPTAYSKCCAKGRVNLAERYKALRARPAELDNILQNPAGQYKGWRDSLYRHVLRYNNNLAFGNINITRSEERIDLHRIVKCNNMINYMLWDFNPPDGGKPHLHGQLFTIPPADARTRLGEISREHSLDEHLMEALYGVLLANHKLAVVYETAAETYRQLPEEDRVQFRMLLVDTNKRGTERRLDAKDAPAPDNLHVDDRANLKHIHPGRLETETDAGSRLVAQIFLDCGANVMPPSVYDVVLTGRANTKIVHMKWWNRNIDPANFPLIFSFGQFGYEYGTKLVLRQNEHFDSTYKQIRDKNNNLLDAAEDLGEDEEFLGSELEQQFHRRDNISRSQWFRYMAHIRGPHANWRDGHWLWDWRTLAQLYTITFNNRMEAQKVQYMKQLQGRRRLVLPSSIINWLSALRDNKGYKGDIGRVYMTDEHFRGSRQYYQREYANCMTICREVGKPDLLVTLTMDPDCPELDEMLPTDPDGQRQQWYDRPDVICRLFVDKFKELCHDLTVKEVMGPVRGWFYSLEHQKRGLPHVHFALILDWDRIRSGGNINTPAEYIEQYISAEIPDNPSGRSPEVLLRRELYKTLRLKHIHTCSAKRCLVDGKCVKRFPKPFSYDNVYNEHAYPRYRRRPPATDDRAAARHPEKYGRHFEYKDKSGKTIWVDNRYVVPFNAFLTSKYKAHINTEFVAGEGCTKYLCKYVMKGADMAFIQVDGGPDVRQKVDYDEFHQIRLARYITSMEAILSLWGTKLVGRSHEVDELDVHGPSGHRIAVEQGFDDEEENLNAICEAAQAEEERRQRGEERVTQLTAYFAFNEANPPIGLSYANCYKRLRYDRAKKQWKLYVDAPVPKFCRLKTVSPSNRELLAIRLLLLVVPDPKGWESLRTVNGNIFPTFVAAAENRGLLTDEDLWMKTIDDAFRMKKSIRQRIRWLAVFFATANLASPCTILDKILITPDKWLLKTSVAKASPEEQKQYVLHAMEWFLLANGITPDSEPREDGTYESACEHIGLPRPQGLVLSKEIFMKLAFFRDDALNEHLHVDFLPDGQRRGAMRQDYLQKYLSGPKPNEEQQQLIDAVQTALEHVQQVIDGQCPDFLPDIQRLFMVTGEGGAGKTFTYNKIIARAKSAGINFLPMASTGIAAELLYEGQTVHKRLCRLKQVDSSTSPNVDNESNFANMLRNIHGILIDEISMQHRDVLEFVDRLLRSVATQQFKDVPFAGKVVIIGGDWKQLAPVIPGGAEREQLEASVKNSPLFADFKTVRLRANHRLKPGQQHYRAFLKRIGIGALNNMESRVQLPPMMVQPSRCALIDEIFPAELLSKPLESWQHLSERAILCPLNRDTLQLNETIMDRLTTDERVYYAVTLPVVDKTGEADLENIAADANHENLCRMTPPGVPEHILRVRVGAVMMVTRNISLEEGLCNGTRVQVMELFDNIIRCRILTGTHVGNEHDIHAARFVFGGDPKAPHEGPIKCERIQYPLRPGSVMTINKSQGQTLARVGVLLDTSQCFAHGQLYVALSRVRDSDNIRVCTTRSDRCVKNVVIRELLDEEEEEMALAALPDDPNDPFPRHPPAVSEPDDERPFGMPNESVFKTPTQSARAQHSKTTPIELNNTVSKQHLDKLTVVKGDITKQQIWMIVNAANSDLVKGGGVDDAIHRACSPRQNELKELLKIKILSNGGPIADGGVVDTPAFGGLANSVKYILHAIGPKVSSTLNDHHRRSLAKCYTNALDHLSSMHMDIANPQPRSIAFPSISTGAFNFPRVDAAHIAITAILNWLADQSADAPAIDEVRLVAFSDADLNLYKEIRERVKRQLNAAKRPTPKTPLQTPLRIPIASPTTSRLSESVERIDLAMTPTTSRAPVPPFPIQQQRRVRIVDVRGPLCSPLLAVTMANIAFNLRQQMFALLRQIVDDPNCFPRGFYTDRARFMRFIEALLLGDNITNFDVYIENRTGPTAWADASDSLLAAVLLGQTIVVVSPIDPDNAQRAWDFYDNSVHHSIGVFFQDGNHMRMQQDFPDEQLQNFTVHGHQGQQRQVQNPIVIWYNGLNHFLTVLGPEQLNYPAAHNIVTSQQYVTPAHLYQDAMDVGPPLAGHIVAVQTEEFDEEFVPIKKFCSSDERKI